MPIMATAGSGTTFKPAPAGVHQAVCVDVVDMGLLEVTYAGETNKKHKVRLVYQIEEVMEDGKPFICQKRYTLSLHEKANLRHDLESWRGRPFTDAELMGFDLEILLGVNCLLNIMHVQKGGETYANITAVMPVKKGMPRLEARSYVRAKDRDTKEYDQPSPDTLMDDSIPF